MALILPDLPGAAHRQDPGVLLPVPEEDFQVEAEVSAAAGVPEAGNGGTGPSSSRSG